MKWPELQGKILKTSSGISDLQRKLLGDLTVKMKRSPTQKELLFLLGFRFIELKILLFLFKRLLTPQTESIQEICCLKQEQFSFKKTQTFVRTLGTLRMYCFWKVICYFWSHIGVPSFRDVSTDLLEQPRSTKLHQLENLYFMKMSIPGKQHTLPNRYRLPTEEQNMLCYPFLWLRSPSQDSQMVHSYQLYAEDFFSFICQEIKS